ncbi:hypothetical protein ACFQ94_09890, partial [Bacillus velezensis]
SQFISRNRKKLLKILKKIKKGTPPGHSRALFYMPAMSSIRTTGKILWASNGALGATIKP